MFYHDRCSIHVLVRVPEGQRDWIRFLWWPGGDLTQDLQEYQVNVRLFGAVSSLSCSNFCLKKAAVEDSAKEVEVESSDVLKKYFYVGDCLRSEKTENLAIERIKGVRRACARRGFHLYQQKKILNTVPEEERSKNVRILST